MSVQVRRSFVTLSGRWGTRQVHYRYGGDGPLLLMLHQSPQSSRELVPLIEAWGADFSVVAPDSPGYGASDPLPSGEFELEDFAAATIEFMDAIGAGRFGVYGFHTGGMIGVALAHQFPSRVTTFACNGMAVLAAAEREEILAEYLPPFEPRWDGGHLAWLWSRMREQNIFFPWFKRTLAARMDYPLSPPERLHAGAMEMLCAGDHYRDAYRAAFAYRGERAVPDIRVPGLITAAALDPLHEHLGRLENDVPAGVTVDGSPGPDEALARCREQVLSAPGDAAPDWPAAAMLDGRPTRDIVNTPDGAIALRRAGSGGRPLVVLHSVGGSSATVEPIVTGLAAAREVIAIDLPEHGETDVALAEGNAAAVFASATRAVELALSGLGCTSVDVLGIGAGAVVALRLAADSPETVGRVWLMDLPAADGSLRDAMVAHGMPALTPDAWGGHLLQGWQMVRDSRLYFPWFQRDQAGIRWSEPELNDRDIQLELTELLKAEGAWQRLMLAELSLYLPAALASCEVPCTVCSATRSPWHDLSRLAAQTAGIAFVSLPDSPDGWVAEFAEPTGA